MRFRYTLICSYRFVANTTMSMSIKPSCVTYQVNRGMVALLDKVNTAESILFVKVNLTGEADSCREENCDVSAEGYELRGDSRLNDGASSNLDQHIPVHLLRHPTFQKQALDIPQRGLKQLPTTPCVFPS